MEVALAKVEVEVEKLWIFDLQISYIPTMFVI